MYLSRYLYNLKIYAVICTCECRYPQSPKDTSSCEPPNMGSRTLTPALYKSHTCSTPLYGPFGSPSGFSEIGFHIVQAGLELTT